MKLLNGTPVRVNLLLYPFQFEIPRTLYDSAFFQSQFTLSISTYLRYRVRFHFLFSIIDSYLSNRKKEQENGNLYQDVSIYLTSPKVDDNLRSSARNVPICGPTVKPQKSAIIVEVFPEDDDKTAKVTYSFETVKHNSTVKDLLLFNRK